MKKKSGEPTSIGPALENLAKHVAALAMTNDIQLDQKVDIFKALTTYWAMKNKLAPVSDDKGKGLAKYGESLANGGGAVGVEPGAAPDF